MQALFKYGFIGMYHGTRALVAVGTILCLFAFFGAVANGVLA